MQFQQYYHNSNSKHSDPSVAYVLVNILYVIEDWMIPYAAWCEVPQNCSFLWVNFGRFVWGSGHPLTHGSLRPCKSTPKLASHSFSQLCTAHSWSTNGFQQGQTTPRIFPFPWGHLHPLLIYSSFGQPESTTQTTPKLVLPFCRAHDHDQQMDGQTLKQTVLPISHCMQLLLRWAFKQVSNEWHVTVSTQN